MVKSRKGHGGARTFSQWKKSRAEVPSRQGIEDVAEDNIKDGAMKDEEG
jgi:hypothetical protein